MISSGKRLERVWKNWAMLKNRHEQSGSRFDSWVVHTQEVPGLLGARSGLVRKESDEGRDAG
jgi:hypothetical protein